MRLRLEKFLVNTVVKIAAVVFLLNTTLAYGACCIETTPTPDVVGIETSALPPCHQAKEADNDEPSSSCCVACVPAIAKDDFVASSHGTTPTFPPSVNAHAWASEVAQRFRPPINA